MTGRALVIGILCLFGSIAGLSPRINAQSQENGEDMSTGEISEEVSSADSISDETSVEDDLSDDLFPPKGEGTIPRPQKPLQPTR